MKVKELFVRDRKAIAVTSMVKEGDTVYIYKDGKLVRGATRGNGVIGEDITHNVETIKNIPLTISIKDEIEVAVQINSKMRTKLMVPNSPTEEVVKELIFADEKLSAELEGKTIKKLIIVPNRLINIIV